MGAKVSGPTAEQQLRELSLHPADATAATSSPGQISHCVTDSGVVSWHVLQNLSR
jgi:hypothetical protein